MGYSLPPLCPARSLQTHPANSVPLRFISFFSRQISGAGAGRRGEAIGFPLPIPKTGVPNVCGFYSIGINVPLKNWPEIFCVCDFGTTSNIGSPSCPLPEPLRSRCPPAVQKQGKTCRRHSTLQLSLVPPPPPLSWLYRSTQLSMYSKSLHAEFLWSHMLWTHIPIS
jgi:hypothetical protein